MGGITGGILFNAFPYFGTDQSQVQDLIYPGKSIKESQMGLIMNGILKVPIVFILLTGVQYLFFFQFNDAPLHFNPTNVEKVKNFKFLKQL